WTVRLREGKCHLAAELEGEVAFSADETTVARIGRGGRLHLHEERPGVERDLVVTAGADGRPAVVWQVAGERRPWDAAGRAWLAALVPELYRVTGIDAAGRVARLLARGGVDAVLGEVELIASDVVAATYLTELLRQADPDPRELERLLATAGRSIASDHGLATLLVTVVDTAGADIAALPGFLAACETVGS